MSNQFPSWSEEKVAALTKAFYEGKSGSQIGRLLGISRNAAIGKCHRLGLKRGWSADHKARARAASQSAPAKPRREPQPTNATLEARERAMKPAPVPASKPVLLTGLERPWTERQWGQCAYPVAGEGADTLSCCAPTGGAPYCAGHRAILYTSPDPEPPRRKRVVREPTFYDVEAA